MKRCTADEAVARLHPEDTLAVPLGPGQPVGVLQALAGRDDWKSLTVFAGLLCQLFPVFARPGVHLRSAFFGPAERALQAAGHDVAFLPGDFRRFRQVL